MKTKLHLLLLFLFPSFLSAQIYVKLNLDDTGLYTVVVKTERAIFDPVVGSGQITITAPFGGFKIGEITSINAEWNKSPDIINQSVASAIEHDYFFIGLRDGDGFNSMSICEEQTLFTFRNIGVNTGRAALITNEDPMVTKEIDLNNNPYHDLSIFDSSTGNLHNIGGTYNTVTPPQYMELTETICKGDSFLFNGAELTEAGIYRDTIQYDNGCYDYRVLNLVVNPNGNISQTLILQPNAEDGKDAFLLKNLDGDTTNYGSDYRMMILAGTNSGVPNYVRSLIDFDFTAIPSNAIIDKAELTLYYEPITPWNNFVHRGDAAFYLQRITSNWEEHTVTWATQPSYSEKNKIAQPTLTGKQSLNNLDVTSLIKDMIAEPENSFGLLFRLQTEERYRTLQLASSDIDDPSLHPKLEITYTYTVPNEITLQDTICHGENYDFNGEILTEAGVYRDTLQNDNGCDSIIVLNLAYYTAGTIGNNQLLCDVSLIQPITALTPVVGTGVTYQWQQSTNNQNFTNVDGAVAESYLPVNLNETTYFRRLVNFEGGVCQDTTNVIKVEIPQNEVTKTLVLQPSAEDGKDAFLLKNLDGDTTNRGSIYRMMITAGTNSGVPNYARSLIDFDFTAIPSNAIIDKAELTLYYDPITPGNNFVHRGDAAFYLQRITSNWEEHTVTWANQPSYSEKNRIAHPTLTGKQNLDNLDVTSLIKDMIAEPENSFGFLFRLQTEERYRTLQLASSDIDDSSLHPKLEITYTIPNETISAICDSINTEIPIDTIVQPSIEITDIEKTTVASAVIKWMSTQVAISYELQVRIKNTSSIWETAERLNTNVTKAYFYGPMNKIFEFRVIAYYENGEQVISDTVEHSTFRED